ncbi:MULTISPECIES: antitoxin MazE family protein [Methylomonas]|nr:MULTISPECIES: antitoxin MazE family protein [Methylomonas]
MMSISTSARVQKHRQSLREAGLRPLQIWVPDTRRNGFADECRRQSLLIRDDAADQETCMWLEAVADHDGWQ